jgi:two-component system, cell cycle response regulator
MAIPARRMNSLPTPNSMLAIQIVQAAVRPNITVTELVTLCQSDPALVGRLISYVNSSGFGLNRTVASVAHAVSLLGIRGTRNLALATCVTDMTPIGPEGDALFAVCLRRGVTAKLLAEKLGRTNTDDYFTLGILLEVGLLVKARADLRLAAELARAPAATRVTLEKAAGQEDHAKLAARLARAWVFDEELTNALAHHHDKTAVRTQLGIAAWLTEHLAGVFESNDVVQSRLAAVEAGASVAVSASDIDALLKRIPEALREAGAFFERDIGPQTDIDSLLRDANGAISELNRNYTDVVQLLEAVLKEKDRLVAELEVVSDKLTNLALTDALTGLGNRRAFEDALARDMALADRQAAAISVLVVDVDDLRLVNERHGQAAGDAVLQAIAEVLVQATRVSDLLARIGGDEFGLILPNTNVEGAQIVAERIAANVAARQLEAAGVSFQVTVSLGLAMTRGPGCRGREQAMFDAAAQAMLLAKSAGQNRFQVGSL